MFKTIDFVAYELIVPENLKPSDQFSKLLEYKFITAKFISNIKGVIGIKNRCDWVAKRLVPKR